jgi:hypothetical protein
MRESDLGNCNLTQIQKIMVNPIEKFTINNISKNLNKINAKVSLSHSVPFPQTNLLSRYKFKKRFVEISPYGQITGGFPRMITSLIDFSFLRSIVAPRYSPYGPPCYDPVSLFLLALFRYIDNHLNMSTFVSLLSDDSRARAYKAYAGIFDHIPCEATFSNFHARVGETLYNEIFHVLVDIFHKLKMITFSTLSVDGTLYPSWARYRGCCYFDQGCKSITVPQVIEKVRNRILYRLNNLANHNLGAECRVYTDCPSDRFADDIKKPKVELFSFNLSFSDGEPTNEQKNTACLFGVEDELAKHHLCINTIRSKVTNIDPLSGSITIRCSKLPKDTDAKIGVRRDLKNPNKKEKVFGYNAIFSTSVEFALGIELPVAANNIAGNAEEANFLIKNFDQIYEHHDCEVKIVIADSKYDTIKNYEYVRGKGAIAIIDYNPRRENLKKCDLIDRGYDQNGQPFSPCGLLCRPNGFDEKRQRLTFCCFKQCQNLNYQALKDLQGRFDIATCPHLQNQTGFVRHMYVKEHPRLINEVPRGSKRYKHIKKLRSSSERTNSSLKEAIPILNKPRVLNSQRANIQAQMAGIVLLLKRSFSFIAKITTLIRKLCHKDDPAAKKKLCLCSVAKSILNIIERKRE